MAELNARKMLKIYFILHKTKVKTGWLARAGYVCTFMCPEISTTNARNSTLFGLSCEHFHIGDGYRPEFKVKTLKIFFSLFSAFLRRKKYFAIFDKKSLFS